MTALRAQRNLAFFLANSFCVLLASRATLFAISFWVVGHTGNAADLANMLGFAMLLEVVCRFVFANIGDRFNKKSIVILTSGVVSASALFLIIITSSDQAVLWMVAIPIAALSACNAIRIPVNASMLRFIVDEKHLSKAITLNQSIATFGSIASPVVAGLIITLGGVAGGLIMACVAAMLSMALLFGIQYRHKPSDTHIKTMFALHRDSWALYRKIKPELTIAYACAILNCVMFAFFSVFIPYFANTVSEDGAWIMGALNAIFSIGLFVAAALLQTIGFAKATLMSRAVLGFISLATIFSVIAILIGLNPLISPIYLVAMMSLPLFIGGAALFIVNNSLSIIRMHASPKESLSSILAFSSTISGAFIPLGLFLSGSIIDSMGMVAFCFVVGGMVMAAWLLLTLNPHVAEIRSMAEVDFKGFYTRRYLTK